MGSVRARDELGTGVTGTVNLHARGDVRGCGNRVARNELLASGGRCINARRMVCVSASDEVNQRERRVL